MTEPDDEEVKCAGCENDELPHDECGYRNEECPEGCSTEHEVERPQFDCPEAGETYRWCDGCAEFLRGSWYSFHEVHGQTYCDPWEHGWSPCFECGEWVDSDIARYSERRDADYCAVCFDSVGGFDGGSSGEEPRYCAVCCSNNLHLHLLTEDFLCDHRAVEAHALGQPIHFAHDAPARKLLAHLRLAA